MKSLPRSLFPARSALLCFACTVFAAGCADEEFGTVTGCITLDGAPLVDATVNFRPVDGRRPSIGVTDTTGSYELHYSLQRMGAWIGEHRVAISTLQLAPSGDTVTLESEETIPARYNIDTELTAIVTAGQNQLDFDLTSDGEIKQPEFLTPPPIEFEDPPADTPDVGPEPGNQSDV